MKIDDKLIDHIAHLSRLSFEGDERDAIKKDMEQITDFIEKLGELDTNNVEPLIFMNEEVNRLREDEAKQTLSHEEILKNAPKKDSDYFRIPKVLDKTNE
jgi:aspartyl-tRNA(Asn)/glutamyl-tRNA(Gln) amidotransferase subunit C